MLGAQKPWVHEHRDIQLCKVGTIMVYTQLPTPRNSTKAMCIIPEQNDRGKQYETKMMYWRRRMRGLDAYRGFRLLAPPLTTTIKLTGVVPLLVAASRHLADARWADRCGNRKPPKSSQELPPNTTYTECSLPEALTGVCHKNPRRRPRMLRTAANPGRGRIYR